MDNERRFQMPNDKGLLDDTKLDTVSYPDLSFEISDVGDKYNLIPNG